MKSVAFSPNGRTIAAGGLDSVLRVWDLGDAGEPIALKDQATTAIMSVAFGPDGRLLASGGADGTIRLWSIQLANHPIISQHASSSFAASQPLATRNPSDFTASVLTGHVGPVNMVVFSPDGKTLASAGDDLTARLWDVESLREVSVALKGMRRR